MGSCASARDAAKSSSSCTSHINISYLLNFTHANKNSHLQRHEITLTQADARKGLEVVANAGAKGRRRTGEEGRTP